MSSPFTAREAAALDRYLTTPPDDYFGEEEEVEEDEFCCSCDQHITECTCASGPGAENEFCGGVASM